MKAFHGDQQFKADLVAAARAHQRADDYVSGTYHAGDAPRFRGCSVGCSLYDIQRLRGVQVQGYGDHALLAEALGVPEWLCLLQDSIFEGLPQDRRSAWTPRLLAAIPVGAQIDDVRHHLAIRRLTRLADAQRDALKNAGGGRLKSALDQVIAALDQVIACHRSELGDVDCVVDWSAARLAAESAARAAESEESEESARSARLAAVSAAVSVESMWSAWSARLAAESVWSARLAAWEQEAGDLIEILESIDQCSDEIFTDSFEENSDE